MKFLCDQMLIRLGRWLRAAGYDTKIIEKKLDDRDIYNIATKEKRILITRDRHFLDFENGSNVIWLKSNTVENCVLELSKKIQMNWIYQHFSRCLICNEILKKVEE